MTTTPTRIYFFNADGDNIGSISQQTMAALIDSGLWADETPTVSPQPERIPVTERCVECAVCKRQIGIFCPDCFSELRKNAAFSALWHGRDWQQALDAAREVSNVQQ